MSEKKETIIEDLNGFSLVEDFGKRDKDGINLGTYNNLDELEKNLDNIIKAIGEAMKK